MGTYIPPFRALDPQTRKVARRPLGRAIRERGTTVIHITHDLEDAWALTEKIAFLRDGRLIFISNSVRSDSICRRPLGLLLNSYN